MKKTFLFAIACFLFIISCNNESIPAISQENQTSQAVQNFKRALIEMNSSKSLPMTELKKSNEYQYPQLSEQRKDLIMPAAKSLILSTGVKEEQIAKKTNGDKTKIIIWAMQIFQDHYNTPSL